MGTNDDEWVAAVASYVRQNFGNSGGFVKPADVARVRAETRDRKAPWEVEELEAALPVPLVKEGWIVSASHNASIATRGLSLQSWNSGTPQEPGMWFQVELPKPATLIELQFESTSGAYQILEGRVRNTEAPPAAGRGAGRGAAAAGPPPPAPRHGFPRGYKVEVSSDGRAWTAVAEGKDPWHDVVMLSSGGTGVQESIATTTIPFAPVQTKFVRITQTATTENAPVWSIQSLRLYEAAKAAGKYSEQQSAHDTTLCPGVGLAGALASSLGPTVPRHVKMGTSSQLEDTKNQTVVSIMPSIGNQAFEMKVKGHNVLRWTYASVADFKARPGSSGIPFLAPWADRLDEQAFHANGTRYPFDMALGNVRGAMPIHGFLTTNNQWQVVEFKADADIGMGDEQARLLPSAEMDEAVSVRSHHHHDVPAPGGRAGGRYLRLST